MNFSWWLAEGKALQLGHEFRRTSRTLFHSRHGAGVGLGLLEETSDLPVKRCGSQSNDGHPESTHGRAAPEFRRGSVRPGGADDGCGAVDTGSVVALGSCVRGLRFLLLLETPLWSRMAHHVGIS